MTIPSRAFRHAHDVAQGVREFEDVEEARHWAVVEGSDLPVRQTLRELCVQRSTFYTWYRRYLQRGRAGLEPAPTAGRRYWNRIPPRVRQQVVEAALADPERSPRELAWQLTDRHGHFLSESSVYCRAANE